MPQLDAFLKRDFFIENLLFHRARKFYFWMMSFLGKLTVGGCCRWSALTPARRCETERLKTLR